MVSDYAHKHLRSVSIKNFKSVDSVVLSDCRRINVLIGRPNVGKSNILEALALFDVPYMVNTANKSIKNIVRIENTADIFHNGQYSIPVTVSADDNIQFFITTHSPYVMTSLLERAGDDMAVYIVDIDNNSTIVKRLTEIQLQDAYDNGIDMFYNIETYLTND